MKDFKLDTFIKGENVNLKIPTLNFVKNSNWYNLLNSKKNTKYLYQGIFPNTLEEQIIFFKNSKLNNRLNLIIFDKKDNFIGVISLSGINFEKKSADIALILNQDKKIGPVAKNFLSSLKSIALMTEHAFENLGLQKISASQIIDLKKWQNLMELVGYKLEGIGKQKFVKGIVVKDMLMISCVFKNYTIIKNNRQKIWDSNKNMLRRIKNLPNITALDQLNLFFNNLDKNYYKKIFNI